MLSNQKLKFQNFLIIQNQIWKKKFRKDINIEIAEFLLQKSRIEPTV